MLRSGEKSINEYLSLILGLIVCNNVVYLYQGNSTNINIASIYCFILFVFLIMQRNFSIPIGEFGNYLESGLKLYSLTVFVLFVPATILFISTKFYLSPLKGVIAYILIFFVALDVILLREYKEKIFQGLLVGFIINIALSFFQYYCYLRGSFFSLSTWFPQTAFQENIFMYRAQGVFLETSYFAAFISITIPIILTKINSFYANAIILGVSLFLLGMSFTGNIVNCIFGLALYFFIIGKEKMKGKANTGFKIFILLVIVAIVGITFNNQIIKALNMTGFADNFSKGLLDAIITNTNNNVSNSIRLNYQLKALKLIPDHLFGVGYNMSSPLLQLKYGIVATFNVLITNQLELGFIGLISYLIIIYNTGIRLILRGVNTYQKSLGIAMIVMFIAQVGNGIRWFEFCIVIYGLAIIECYEICERKNQARINI